MYIEQILFMNPTVTKGKYRLYHNNQFTLWNFFYLEAPLTFPVVVGPQTRICFKGQTFRRNMRLIHFMYPKSQPYTPNSPIIFFARVFFQAVIFIYVHIFIMFIADQFQSFRIFQKQIVMWVLFAAFDGLSRNN